jgi:hypothetical protein
MEMFSRSRADATLQKYNQIRCFTKRDVELTVVPWNHNIAAEIDKYDGLFLSNGPGDPTMCKPTIEQIKKVLVRFLKKTAFAASASQAGLLNLAERKEVLQRNRRGGMGVIQ